MSGSGRPSQVPPLASASLAKRWCWLCLLPLSVGGLGLWAWNSGRFDSTIPVPAIDLSQASRELATAVLAARIKVEQDPRSAASWGELGMWLMAHQFEHEAIVCLQQAERWDAQDFRWPYLLGLSLSVVDRDRALVEFRRALTLRDEWPVAHLRLGELLLAREDFAEAERALRVAYRQDENDPRTSFNLSRLCLMRGDLAAALDWARRAARLAPDVQSIHELLAAIHQRLGDRESATAELQISERASTSELGWNDELAAKVLALRRDTGRQLELAQALLHAKRHEEAIRVLQAARQDDERDVQIVVLLAQTLNQLRRRHDVESLLQAAQEKELHSAELWFQRGVAQFQDEEWDAAVESFCEAIRIKPDHALAHYNLGHTLLRLDRPDDAERAFVASARLRPQFIHAQVNAARLQLQRGANADAGKHLKAASMFQPDDPEVRQLLRERQNAE